MVNQKELETAVECMKLADDLNDVLEESQELSPSERRANPYAGASFLSKLFFRWPQPLLEDGMTRIIQESDLPGR
jgi:hypothetical protein